MRNNGRDCRMRVISGRRRSAPGDAVTGGPEMRADGRPGALDRLPDGFLTKSAVIAPSDTTPFVSPSADVLEHNADQESEIV